MDRNQARLWKVAVAVARRFGRKHETPVTPEQEAYFKTPEGIAELTAYFHTKEGKKDFIRSMRKEIAQRQPSLRKALWEDARIYSSGLMQPPQFDTRWGFVKEAARLAWESDCFFCLMLYRVRTRLAVHDVPVLPMLLHRACMMLAQMDIGNAVVIQPGVYFPHGQVVIDGLIEIGSGTVISPWVTLGRYGPPLEGPQISPGVFVGTGAKLFGPIKVGEFAKIGANAVVFEDVPPRATVTGVPGKVVREGPLADDPPDGAGATNGDVRRS